MPLENVESDVFGYNHAEVGAGLTRRWNFPTEICAAIEDHHQQAVEAPPTHLLVQANEYCHWAGLWCGLDTDEGRRAYGAIENADPLVVRVVEKTHGGQGGLATRVGDFLNTSGDREQRWDTPSEDSPAGAEQAQTPDEQAPGHQAVA